MEVFKIQAEKATCKAAAQRVLREQAFAQTVDTEAQATVAVPPTPLPELEVEYPDTTEDSPSNIPVILQDKDNAPAANTWPQQQNCTLTQDYMLHMMEIKGYTAPFTARQAASHQYPLQFLCDFENAVLDNNTGDLLEYCHLIKHPKYKDTWSKSFGKEIRCLATVTETIFFINKTKIPKDRKSDKMYARIECVFCDGKKDKYRTRITMGGNLVNYPGDCGTPTADLLTVKLLLNRIISTSNSKFMTIDSRISAYARLCNNMSILE
jgi:hypothetical protein